MSRRGRSSDEQSFRTSVFSEQPRESNSQPQMFRIEARNNTKKEDDLRSNLSFRRMPKDLKLSAYKNSLGPSTFKNLRLIGRNIGK